CFIAGWCDGAKQKQKPTSSRQRVSVSPETCSFTPSVSSACDEPERLVMARLPCLATTTPRGRPMAATTSPAAVEMLKNDDLVPPTPQVSTTVSPWGTS